jgi:hypothetical protein
LGLAVVPPSVSLVEEICGSLGQFTGDSAADAGLKKRNGPPPHEKKRAVCFDSSAAD